MSSLSHFISAEIPIESTIPDVTQRRLESLLPLTPKIIAVGGGKGGVGKTFFAANLSYQLTRQKRSVILIDTNFGSPSLNTYFNSYNPKFSLKELILNPEADINQLAFKTNLPNLKVIFGSPGTLGISESSHIIVSRIIRSIKKLKADYVVLDLGTGLNLSDVILFLQADEGIIITNPEPTSMQEAFNFFKCCLLKKLETIVSGQPALVNLINQAYEKLNDATSETLKSLIHGLNKSNHQTGQLLQNFRPGFLLNKVYNKSELLEAAAFQMAIEEIFGIQLKYWGSLNFYPQLKKFTSSDLSLEKFEQLSSFYKRMAEQFIAMHSQRQLANDDTIDRKSGVRTSRTVSYDQEMLICSQKCALWNNCTRQRGGYPCKMKYIGFLKTL